MAWRDRLQPASFRGIPFYVEGDDGTFGRRKQLHEYPMRDKPYVEDLGRKAREYSVSAFLVGADYMEARDKLLEAIEQPGAGQLVHPYYGRLQVDVLECSVSHRRENGGMCEIRFSFVESGELAFPQAKDRTQTMASRAADALSVASLADFAGRFGVGDFPQFVSDDAQLEIESALDVTAQAMRYAQPGVAENTFSVQSLLSDPALLGSKMVGMFVTADVLFEKAEELGSEQDKADYYSRHIGSALDVHAALPHDNSVGDTPSRRQMIENANLSNGLMRRQALSNAVGAASLMPILVRDDVDVLRDRLCRAVDDELPLAPDAVLDALLDLRNRAWRDLADRSRDSARLVTVKPLLPIPAVVLAYDLYEDATRADEIVARNRAVNPAFLSGNLQVLSR